jgi:DNA invertase Pin-like site-specific DNA recombinase
VTMFSLFGEIERDLISERTKEGLRRAVSEGKQLGRPAGPRVSRFDARKDEIQSLLNDGVGIASIAKICKCSWPAMKHFITSRGMVKA